MNMYDLYGTAEDVIRSHLDAGERLLWAGQPRGGVIFRAQDWFLIPFSILWAGFAFFWEGMVIYATWSAESAIPIVFALFGLPFVILGLYLLFGRFIIDAKTRARTYYGVTDRRIIIVRGLLRRKIDSLQLRTLTDVGLTEYGNGSGTITFGPTGFLNAMFPVGAWPGAHMYAPPSFDHIEQPKDVYRTVLDAQRSA